MKHIIMRTMFCFILINSSNVFATELSEQTIQSWIQSQNALEDWGRKHKSKLEATESSSQLESPASITPESMIAPLKKAGLYKSANQVITQYGFSSIDEWASTTLRITNAAAAIEFEAHPEMLDSSQLETLRSTEGISPEHKQLLSKAIEQNQAMVKQILDSANSADIEAVRPHLEQILKMMEEPY